VRTVAELQKALRSAERGYRMRLLRGDSELTILIR
jgi:hypothetical protein